MESTEIQKVRQLLAAKDDTSRFVGLLLLKTTLDNHASSMQYEQITERTLWLKILTYCHIQVWDSVSAKFLDRLIRTGSRPTSSKEEQARDMLNAAVAVIYTFTRLLNDCAVNEKLYSRISGLINATLYASEETTQRILDSIHGLVQQPHGTTTGGASHLASLEVGNWTPLIEIASKHDTVFLIFYWTWVEGTASAPVEVMQPKIDEALQLFVSCFKRQNPTPLVEFFTRVLSNLNPLLRPSSPQWLQSVTSLMKQLSSSKPTEDGRRAYIHCSAVLLEVYPEQAPQLLFSDESQASERVAYLFVKMVQVDIMSTIHVLIPKLSTKEYGSISKRIAAALDITTSFVGFLIGSGEDDENEDEDLPQHSFSPDQILKIHEDLIRTVGDTMEFLRDRWDDHLAKARGIEPAQGQELSIFDDPVTAAAIRFIAAWLRDDDGETLRSQAAGLFDLFTKLYKLNLTSKESTELRLPILAATEGIIATEEGLEAIHTTEFVTRCLMPDLQHILLSQAPDLSSADYLRGSAIIFTLDLIEENDDAPALKMAKPDVIDFIARSPILSHREQMKASDLSLLHFQSDLIIKAMILASTEPVVKQETKAALNKAASAAIENWKPFENEGMITRMQRLLDTIT
ncbi:DUF1941-domain-containing protein [Xylariaceae sp. FL1019]|nr:DUF1941-domain-containing protein [Xylariaceae sp. FL1019]